MWILLTSTANICLDTVELLIKDTSLQGTHFLSCFDKDTISSLAANGVRGSTVIKCPVY